MKSNLLKKIIVSLSVVATVCSLTAVFMANTPTPPASLDSLSMKSGASVLVTGLEKKGNGLRYQLTMNESDYSAFKTSYQDATFGILIAPEEYLTEGHELNYENVFGGGSIYDWATWNGTAWEYTGNKVRIVNIYGDEMTPSQKVAGTVEFSGSLVNIKDGVNDATTNNLTREFRGVGYVKYTEGAEVVYKFYGSDENVRSMVYVAQQAIADSSSTLSGEYKTWLQENYVDAVTDEATTYTVKHYKQQADGYALADTDVLNATVDDSVEAVAKEYAGYTFNETLGVIAGKVFANGKLTLELYYDKSVETVKTDLGLLNKSATQSVNLEQYSAYTERTLVHANTKEAVEAELSGNSLDLNGLNGAYLLTLANATTVNEITFDVYDSSAPSEWNEVKESAGAVSPLDEYKTLTKTTVGMTNSVPSGITASENSYMVTGADEAFAFGFLANHSTAYYNLFADTGYALTFDYYVEVEQGEGATKPIAYTRVGFANDEKWTEIEVGTWHNAKISMESAVATLGGALLETDGNFYQAVTIGGQPVAGAALSGANACTVAKWYITNIAYAQDVTAMDTIRAEGVLIDLDEAKSSLFEKLLLTPDQQASFETYKTVGEVVWTANGVTATDASALDGVTKVVATLNTGSQSVTLYEGSVDFYRTSDGLVWSPTSGLRVDDVYLKGTNATVSVVTGGAPSGMTADEYYLIDSANCAKNGSAYFRAAIARHSKAYYEMWLAKASAIGANFFISFDMWYTTTATIGYSQGYSPTDSWTVFSFGGATKSTETGGSQYQVPEEKKHTQKVSLLSLVNNFDNFYDEKQTAFGTFGLDFLNWQDGASITGDNIDMKVYIGNFQTVFNSGITPTVKEGTTLVDMNGKDSFDYTTLLGDAEIPNGAIWKLNGEVVSDWTKVDGVYTVTAGFDFPPYDLVAFTATVDFYNSAEEMVFVPQSGLQLNDIYSKTPNATLSVVKDNLPSSLTAGEYLMFESSGEQRVNVSLSRHGKEYYQMWIDKAKEAGFSFTITYDIYYTSTAVGQNGWTVLSYGVHETDLTGTGHKQFQADTLTTSTFTLDSFVAHYDNFYDKTQTDPTGWSQNFLAWEDGLSATFSPWDMKIYFGNFKTNIVMGDTIDTTKSLTASDMTLVDMKDKSTYDPTQLLSPDEQTALAGYSNLVWKANGEVVSDWTALDGVYTVTAEISVPPYSIPVYTTTVDFYNSNDGMVWIPNSGLKVSDVYAKNANSTVSIVTSGMPTGAKATEYYYIENATVSGNFAVSIVRHSKAYYQAWLVGGKHYANKTYTIAFEMAWDSVANTTVSGGYVGYNPEGEYSNWTLGSVGSGKQPAERGFNDTTRYSVTLDAWVNCYDNFVNLQDANIWSNNMLGWSTTYADGKDVKLWVGNFTVTETDATA